MKKIKNFFYSKIIHIVGIGGIGMSAIAQLLHKKNFIVQGCDIKENDLILKLIKLGLNVSVMKRKNDILYCDLIVRSSAVKKKNIKMIYSIRNRKKDISRSTLISELVKSLYNICITGTHGKTSVSSMIYNVVKEAKILPTIICGGIVKSIKNNYREGKNNVNIVESDESDGTFIFLPSNYQVINNNDIEHLDYFKNGKNLKSIFRYYVQRINKNKIGLICNDCINLKKNNTMIRIYKRYFSYSIKLKKYDLFVSKRKINKLKVNISMKKSRKTHRIMSIKENKKREIHIKNKVGRHKILNVLTTNILYSLVNGHKFLLNYSNKVKKRSSKVIKIGHVNYIEDYAHHPEEIKSSLDCLRKKRIITIFEPHNITRIKTLKKQFMTSFYKTDILININVFSKKNYYKNVFSIKFIKKIQNISCNAFHFKNITIIRKYLFRTSLTNDCVLIMGAGNIFQIANKVIKKKNTKQYIFVVRKVL